MNTRDRHALDTAHDALSAIVDLLDDVLPGDLAKFSLNREGGIDRLELQFVLDAVPDVEYYYSHVIYDDRQAPMDPRLIVSVVHGALVERVRTWRKEPVDGIVDLSRK